MNTLQFRLTLDCDNAAFGGAPEAEIARILRAVAQRLEDCEDFGSPVKLRDFNGNAVGTASLSDHLNHDPEEETPMPETTVPIACSECGYIDYLPESWAANLNGPFLCSTRCEENAAQREEDALTREDLDIGEQDVNPGPYRAGDGNYYFDLDGQTYGPFSNEEDAEGSFAASLEDFP